MSRLETQFLEKLGDSWKTATPGFCVQAYSKGKKIVDIEVGKTYPVYDLASLTKVVFTTSALMVQHDEKKFRLTDPVAKWITWFPESSLISLRDLLSHSAGLTWWYPFYKSIVKRTTKDASPEDAWRIFEKLLKSKVHSDLKKNARLKEEPLSVYSDLDFFLLGFALEAMMESSLYEVWTEMRERMGLHQTDFHRNNKPKKAVKNYAPTEIDSWRGKTMQGEVHDENTWSLKGVAPHAGLFGPIEDLSQFGLLLRSSMRDEPTRGLNGQFVNSKTAKLFTKRSVPRAQGDWALGFMMPTRGTASCGPHFSLSSVGHTGFTGTSLWYDPKKDLLVTLLSNRVHPTRANKEFVGLRPQIHSWISEEL